MEISNVICIYGFQEETIGKEKAQAKRAFMTSSPTKTGSAFRYVICAIQYVTNV